MSHDSEEPPLTTQAHEAAFWQANKRRPIFMTALFIGLALFLYWLPHKAWTSLLFALNAQRGLFILISLFVLLALSLIWSAGQLFDARIFRLLNMRTYPLWLDHLMWVTTQLGHMFTAFIAAFLFFIFNFHRLAIEIILGTITLWLLVELIKAIADRDRPFLALDKTRIIGWREKGDSFPSGHTTQIFFVATLLIIYFQLGHSEAIALYAIAVLVGFTRIYVGAHYPRDVMGGVVLGSAWGILATLIDGYWLTLHF